MKLHRPTSSPCKKFVSCNLLLIGSNRFFCVFFFEFFFSFRVCDIAELARHFSHIWLEIAHEISSCNMSTNK